MHVLNHGLHYASSVFEVKELIMGKFLNQKNTLTRLFNAAKTMDMKMPFTVEDILEAKFNFKRKWLSLMLMLDQ